jgi:quercetin dioxygenase-like cupin family protein
VGPVFGPEQAESVSIGGVEVIFRMSGPETDGTYSVLEFRLEPGRLVPPHAHEREHEVSDVLEGEIGLQVGRDELTANQGCIVVKPPRVTHAWWNPTATPARVLEVISPPGLERYFLELAEIHSTHGIREPQLVADLQNRYGITASTDWTPLLKARHRLKLLGE